MVHYLIRYKVRLLYTVLFISLFFSCDRTPNGVLSQSKMKDVMIDMQIAEEMITMDSKTYRLVEEKEALYRAVLQKHHISQAEYDSSIVWYGKNLNLYMQTYNMAIKELDRRIAVMDNREPETDPPLDSDSTDIWLLRRYYEFSPKALNNVVIFDFVPDVAYPMGSIFVFEVNILGKSMQTTPVEMHLRTVSDDTTYSCSVDICKDGHHELRLCTDKTKRTQRVYGYIRLNSKETLYNKLYLDRIRLMKYRE